MNETRLVTGRPASDYLGRPLIELLDGYNVTFQGVIKLDEPPYYLSSIAFKLTDSGLYLRAWLAPHPSLYSEATAWDANTVTTHTEVRKIAVGTNVLCLDPIAVYEMKNPDH